MDTSTQMGLFTMMPTKTTVTDIDRLSADPDSPYYPGKDLLRRVGVRINGEVMPSNVREFCVSGRWAILQKKVSGKWQTETLTEVNVEVFDRHNHHQTEVTDADRARLAAAEAKRQRKAAKLRSQA